MEKLVHDILFTHPNNGCIEEITEDSEDILSCYLHNTPLTEPLSSLINHIKRHSLPREPIDLPNVSLPSFPGLSPKKRHEITRMASYTQAVINALRLTSVYVVDVGAGQGYLTKTLLHTIPQIKRVLALDSDEEQTRGAREWEDRWDKKLSLRITHKVINITPHSLVSTVDEWLVGVEDDDEKVQDVPVPVIIVGLHACGSLTPDTLRAFIHSRNQPFVSAIVVSCCYNLLRPSDYPLSKSHSHEALHSAAHLPSPLPPSAYHLATQVPSTWRLSETHKSTSILSVRKVVWRALLARLLDKYLPEPGLGTGASIVQKHKPFIPPSEYTSYYKKTPIPRQNLHTISDSNFTHDSTGSSTIHRHLGKLPNKSYTSWDTFLSSAESRLELPPHTLPRNTDTSPEPFSSLSCSLGSLQTLRCLLGPLIESTILRDRREWVEESLSLEAGNPKDEGEWKTALVPLFEQRMGSARNVAFVVVPAYAAADVPGFM